jgi:hypothetical protein
VSRGILVRLGEGAEDGPGGLELGVVTLLHCSLRPVGVSLWDGLGLPEPALLPALLGPCSQACCLWCWHGVRGFEGGSLVG